MWSNINTIAPIVKFASTIFLSEFNKNFIKM